MEESVLVLWVIRRIAMRAIHASLHDLMARWSNILIAFSRHSASANLSLADANRPQ